MTDRCTLISEALGQRNAAPAVREILERYTTLRDLFDATPEELTEIPGIGDKRARQLQAIFLLGRTWLNERTPATVTIRKPSDAASLLLPSMAHLDREVFKVILLNTRHRVIAVETVSVGILDSALVHPRETFKPALRRSASAIVVAHNHPGGSTVPSSDDIAVTKRLVECGRLLGIDVIDHLIIGNEHWVSLKELGYV